jgi:hypothetical protein
MSQDVTDYVDFFIWAGNHFKPGENYGYGANDDRMVTVVKTVQLGGATPWEESYTIHHTDILRDLGNYGIARCERGSEEEMLVGMALELVVSDLETGTSLESWPRMRVLVERLYARAIGHNPNLPLRLEFPGF